MAQFRYIARCSFGNDSVAMLQHMRERGLKDVAVVYSDTGWGSEEWDERVSTGEAWVRSLGWDFVNLTSVGMEHLVRTQAKNGIWPTRVRKFCTKELKIKPFLRWVATADPDCKALICVGVRRAESKARVNHPEFMPEADDGRHVWHPLIHFSDDDRNVLVSRTPLPLTEGRSRECEICINANKDDLKRAGEPAIARVERIENEIGQPMFNPAKMMGATGIREAVRWGNSERGAFVPVSGVVPAYPPIEAVLDDEPATCEDNYCGL